MPTLTKLNADGSAALDNTVPVMPSRTVSAAPPAGVVITGTPTACASISTLGMPSKRESSMKRLSLLSQKPTRDERPTNSTRPAMPMLSA